MPAISAVTYFKEVNLLIVVKAQGFCETVICSFLVV